MTKSANINIPPPPDDVSRSGDDDHRRERSLSDAFEALSLESKERVMAMAGGTRPSSRLAVLPIGTPPSRRHRLDSTDLSPVSISILKFHGIYKKD